MIDKANTMITTTVLVTTPVALILCYLATQTRFGLRVERELPSVTEVVRDFVILWLIFEAYFYYLHRLFHVPWLYQRFHKKHHEFTAPIANSTFYLHPLELFVIHMGVGHYIPFLYAPHYITGMLYLITVQLKSVTEHSGYATPKWFPGWLFRVDPRYHDYHHEAFNVNFGMIGLLDWVHGTGKLPTRQRVPKTTTPKVAE